MDLVLQLYDVVLRVIQKKTVSGYLHRFAVLAEQLNDGEKVLKVKKHVRHVNGLSTLFKPLHVSRFIVAYSRREAATQMYFWLWSPGSPLGLGVGPRPLLRRHESGHPETYQLMPASRPILLARLETPVPMDRN